MTLSTLGCEHVPVEPVVPKAGACQTCGRESPTRLCLTCGHVGCCESVGGHARKHALEEGHPVIRSLPITPMSFTWCYEHMAYLDNDVT